MSTNTGQLYIGVDGGGSKTRAIILNSGGEILGTGLSGTGNPIADPQTALDSIEESARLALRDANLEGVELSDIVAGLGLAGVNFQVGRDVILNWNNPFKSLHLTTDLHVASLGAHDGEDGAVMIMGTGSIGIDVKGDDHFILGGHGFLQGDKGSGAWFGLQAVRESLMAADGLAKPTAMLAMLLDLVGVEHHLELMETMAKKPAKEFAKLARVVFEAAKLNDEVALSIISDGARYLSDLALRLLERKPQRFALVGGLAPVVLPYMDQEVQDMVAPRLNEPEFGAFLFAKANEE